MSEGRGERAGPLLIVTTRSRLRAARLFPVMLVATLRVRRQLARTEGLVRAASLVAGPTEFWTITVWRSRHAMQEFTRSHEHGEIMWRFSKWLSSLWLMRWHPGPDELGSWSGLTMAPADLVAPTGAVVPDWPVLTSVLEDLPDLRSALGPDGVAGYDSSRRARRDRQRVAGGAGVVVRIEASRRKAVVALLGLVRLRRRLRAEAGLLRSVVGIGRPGEVYFLGVWSERVAATRFLAGPWVVAAAQRWAGRFWAGVWLPENEFGHWDGVRLRRERRRAPR